ncbi:hypothetical protein FAM09_11635 [Niastella caeni]|uniref:Uncharacterized protein n=1 Tax=Niastella caeni TaxID=2569763 RepID=A0A4S8HZY9_9BACT|nr:hypothetical protein FAM09_11635 [Niastella caeni]
MFGLATLLPLANVAQGTIKVTDLDKSKIPAGIKYLGKLKNAIRWTDKLGDNILVTSETGIHNNPKFKHENDGSDVELYAGHYLVGDSLQLTWKVYDFISDCMVDLEASFIKNTLQVTDLNNDGVGEVWLMYKTVCHGDVSPLTMKIIMYEGAQKFAMRGHNKVRVSATKFNGGDYKFDEAFNAGPKAFRDFALQLWNKNIMQVWE